MNKSNSLKEKIWFRLLKVVYVIVFTFSIIVVPFNISSNYFNSKTSNSTFILECVSGYITKVKIGENYRDTCAKNTKDWKALYEEIYEYENLLLKTNKWTPAPTGRLFFGGDGKNSALEKYKDDNLTKLYNEKDAMLSYSLTQLPSKNMILISALLLGLVVAVGVSILFWLISRAFYYIVLGEKIFK